ncbi:MAG: hypothetical protein KAR47_18740, partial [Planctomycetes bacterium]|nr:hypothetical protein [Planctomycetota bacterium]
LDDLHQAYSERAETMEARWFEMAREVSRLKGAALTPVGEELSPRVYIRGLGKKSSSKERKEKEKTGQQ